MSGETGPSVEAGPSIADVLIVASWFPAVDDLGAGRFVADQAEALAGSGRVRVAVASFDGVRLTGGATARSRQAAIAQRAILAEIAAAQPLFVTPAMGVEPGVPVARLAIPEGQTRDAGTAHAAFRRAAVLAALGDRVAAATGGPGRSIGVVHAHTAYPDGVAAIEVADRLGWPLLITEHSSFVGRFLAAPALRQGYAAALARATQFFAVSEMLADELRAAFPAEAAKIRVIPNAVPLGRFSGPAPNERDPDELLFVGYRKATKGIANLLEAFAIARTVRPSLRLRLVGRSPDEPTEAGWHALAGQLGVADAVSFEGSLDRAGVAAAMGRAALFVHPSPRETFGVVAVEALASGTPVVATDSGGVSEILGSSPDALGAIVPVDDPPALGAAILASLERRASFDPARLRASVERFGSDRVAERLIDEYERALASNGPSRRAASRSAWAGLVGRPPRSDRPMIVVALDRERAARRLAALPASLRSTLTLVTSAEPAATAMPELGRVVDVALTAIPAAPAAGAPPPRIARGGTLARIGRLARDPFGTLAGRLGRGAGSGSSVEPATATTRRVVREGGGRLDILPLDGIDHLAVAPITNEQVDAGLRAGGLLDLADRWLASSETDPDV